MARFSIRIVVLGTAALVFSMDVALAAMTHSQQQSLHALLGNWTCVNRGGMGSTTEHDVNTMYGGWVKSDATYSQEGGFSGVDYLGYDSQAHRWVFVVVDQHDGYNVSYSNSANLNGSVWRNGYPAAAGSGVFRMSANRYTFDGTFADSNGKMVAQHSVCTKSGD